MSNLLVLLGASYAVALSIQALCYMQSLKKGKSHAARETVEAGLMAAQNA